MAAPLDLPESPPRPPTKPAPALARNDTIRPSSAASRTGVTSAPPTPTPGTSWSNDSPASAARGRTRSEQAMTTVGPSSSSSTAPLSLNSLPLSPLPSHLAPFLSRSSRVSPAEKRTLFTSVYLRSASSGNADTLEWLLSLPPDPSLSRTENAAAQRRFSLTAASLNNGGALSNGLGLGLESPGIGGGLASEDLPDEAPRKWVDLEATDEEGNTALGLCVALGHAEAVRVLVESGVRVTQGDRAGWTPLHWAVQNNDIPIASYLLNHRASPLIASHKGLTPRDLVKSGKEGAAMREVLKSAWEAAVERERALQRERDEVPTSPGGSSSGKGKARDDGFFEGAAGGRPASRLSIASSAAGMSWLDQREKVEEREREVEMKRRMQLALDSARNLEVDMGVLGLGEGKGLLADDDDSDSEGIPNPFVWDRCLPDQMLVFSLDDLPTLFDVVITTIKPARTRKYRVIPANVLFLCARFAHHWGTAELLEELIIGAMERIEAAVHHRPDDMTNCAFWLSNTLLLLYYLRKEPSLSASTATYQSHLCDLINEIFVFVIRDAERRIDRVLEAAMLEHEPLAGFEDVAFEGEWGTSRFVKKLTGRGKKTASIRSSTSAMSLFSTASDGLGGGGDASFDSAGSPPPASRVVSASQVPLAEATPRSITALLSSTLFILQIYEIPPSIVVQAFSQLFYWIACEVFNRLLTQRKYLCRSRAMQIRLNASNLEDWARANRLPTKMVSVHFAPLNQLLQWLQCLSSESSIDGLIGTIQSLRSLNPLQLRKAVRDYRYEVDESRMDEDCDQYLVQIQKQWERLRVQKTVEGLSVSGGAGEEGGEAGTGSEGGEDAASATSVQEDVTRMIDEVFSDPSAFGSYSPPGGADALGELLNSRYMLPFAVPTSAEMLVNFDQPDAFGPFAAVPPRTSNSNSNNSENGTATPRSISRLSLSSASRLSSNDLSASDAASLRSISTNGGELKPKEPFVPLLPDDFFAVWDAAKARAGYPVGGGANGAGMVGATSGTGGDWQNWREGLPGDDDFDDDDDDASSVRYTGLRDSSSESESSVQETPRPRTGFQ
ncbi:hypothetical protein JCM1840_001800 [Sporobolomyces johnsonii]